MLPASMNRQRTLVRAASQRNEIESFKTWFEPIKPLRLENQSLTIQVPNKIFYEWLEEHFVTLLKSTIPSLYLALIKDQKK